MKNFTTKICLPILGALLIQFSNVSTPADAATWSPLDITVKVRSGLCHNNDFDYRGSGVLLRHKERVFVLTSEHVLLHDNNDFCHSASNDIIGLKRAQLVAIDWSIGLAILELVGFQSAMDLPEFQDIDASLVARNSSTQLVGFPYEYNEPFLDSRGLVLTKTSHRHFLPQANSVIELMHSHGEFGMSGGPVFDEAAQKIVGILSHQYLKLGAGEQPIVDEFSPFDPNAANHLLLISSAVVKPWIEQALNTASGSRISSTYFVKDALDQIAGINIVYSSGLAFAAEHYDEGDTDCPAGSSGGGGVGGDPIGVGGDRAAGSRPIKIHITRDRKSSERSPTEWYLPSKESWRAQLEERLLRPAALIVPALVHRLGDGRLQKICVYSLQEFFRKLTSEDAEAITLVEGDSSGTTPNEQLELLRTRSHELANTVILLKNSPSQQWSRTTNIFFDRIIVIDEILRSESWILLTAKDFEALADLQGGYSHAWQEILRDRFNDGTQILTHLQRISEGIRRIRI